MPPQLHSRHFLHNFLRSPNIPSHKPQIPNFSRWPSAKPHLILHRSVNRTLKRSSPHHVGGIKMRMRDHDRFQAAFGVNLVKVHIRESASSSDLTGELAACYWKRVCRRGEQRHQNIQTSPSHHQEARSDPTGHSPLASQVGRRVGRLRTFDENLSKASPILIKRRKSERKFRVTLGSVQVDHTRASRASRSHLLWYRDWSCARSVHACPVGGTNSRGS